jgi:tRNA threonylcarbamoyladenosine biosynthesis protein TsaB
VRGEVVVFESRTGPAEGGRPRHATAVLPAVEAAAEALGGWEGVERIAVGIGPGSFTGLRIGISSALAAGSSGRAEVVGVGTLDALAQPALRDRPEQRVLATIDARRGEVFAALYAHDGRLWDPVVLAPGELGERLRSEERTALAIGSGAVRFRGELDSCSEIPEERSELHRVAARHVCALGREAQVGDPPRPLYLRPPDAERWRDRNAPSTSSS